MDLIDLLTLTRIPSIGPQRLIALVNHFEEPRRVFRATARELIRVAGIDRRLALTVTHFFRDSGTEQARRWAEKQLSLANKADARAVTIWDKKYPDKLKAIYDPPPVLFIRGDLVPEDNYSIAIVGTRSASDYGKDQAHKFAAGLAALGITVVSGLALGIDSIVHSSTVKAGGRTLAVLGSGVDLVYPPQNSGLADRIIDCGAMISEFMMGTKPDAGNFPRRNRIISGISLGTLVIESDPAGGSMITASVAFDQNREVFAIPSALSDKKKSGTNFLIKQDKAQLVESVDDIVAALSTQFKSILKTPELLRRSPPPQLNVFEQKLYDAMPDTPIHIDTLAQRIGFSTSDVLVHLLSLELKGAVRTNPGKMFVKL